MLAHSGPSAPFFLALRHLGGALGTEPHVANCVGHRSGQFNLYTNAYHAPGGMSPLGDAQQGLLDDLSAWSDGGALLNFLAGPYVTPKIVQGAYAEADFTRLVAIKATWDPTNAFRFTTTFVRLLTSADRR